MLNMLYARPELKHLWRCADLIYASGPKTLVTSIKGVRVVLENHCTTGSPIEQPWITPVVQMSLEHNSHSLNTGD